MTGTSPPGWPMRSGGAFVVAGVTDYPCRNSPAASAWAAIRQQRCTKVGPAVASGDLLLRSSSYGVSGAAGDLGMNVGYILLNPFCIPEDFWTEWRQPTRLTNGWYSELGQESDTKVRNLDKLATSAGLKYGADWTWQAMNQKTKEPVDTDALFAELDAL